MDHPPSSPLVLAVFLVASACADPATKDSKIECTPVPGEICPTDDTGTDTGDDEAGTTTGDPEQLGPDECIHNVTEKFVGIQYQCEGDLYTSLTFSGVGDGCEDALGDFCTQEHVFGVSFQPYAAAEVIACCGEYDPLFPADYDQYCTYDMVQQVCISLAEEIEFYIEQGAFGSYTSEATEVQNWIADHYSECFEALQINSAALPEVVAAWELGDFGDLHDVVLHIDPGTEIYGVNLPADPSEWLACSGANANDDQVLEDAATPPIGSIVVGVDLLADLGGELSGPSIFGGYVNGSATFPATCLAHGCPAAKFSFESKGSHFTLEDLDLYTGAFALTNGSASLNAERAQIELWNQAFGAAVYDPGTGLLSGYAIPAGAAHFMVAGSTDTQSNRFMAVNATDLWISQRRETWMVDAFVLEYEDGNRELWSVAIEASQWQ